jgi:hypothetical protein
MRSTTIPELADLCSAADHVDVKTVVSERSLRELIAASFSWQPAWLRWLFAMRGVLARAFRLENPDTPVQERGVRPDEISMTPGDALWFFTVVTGVEDRYLLLEASDTHLASYLAVVALPSDGGPSTYQAVTIVKYRRWTGALYFALIRPFHHLVVRCMITAGARGG